jgi:hypothetical protein
MSFVPYNSRDFSGCADSFAGQGVCSLCGENPAEYARSRKAYCLECTKRQLTKTQQQLFDRALNNHHKVVSVTQCHKRKKTFGKREFTALEGLVKLGLMEEIPDSRSQTREKGWYCTTTAFRIK